MVTTSECIRGDGPEENNVLNEISQVIADDDTVSHPREPERSEADEFHHQPDRANNDMLLPNYRLNAPYVDDANEVSHSVESGSDNSSQFIQPPVLVPSGAYESNHVLIPHNYRLNAPCLDDANEADLCVIGGGSDNNPQQQVTMANHQEAVMIHVGIINNGKEPHNEATDLATNEVVYNPPTSASLATSTSPQLPEEIMIERNHLDLENSVASSSFAQTGGGDENSPMRPTSFFPTEGGVITPTNMGSLEGTSSNHHRRSTAIQLPDNTSSLPTLTGKR